ncbi:MAG: hypothetical protein IJR54_08075 [Oscillibacter sp.]|nr:hypothetical protein [Oscillibacter sp.]
MKRMNLFSFIAVLALLTLTLTSCGKSEFGLTENTGKLMTIEAKNADKDAFFMAGSLEVADGERIVIAPSLTKGTVRVEIVKEPEEQSMEQLPDMDGEAVITADVSGTEEVSETAPAGSYLLKATCLEKATGTIQMEVTPAA